MNPPPFRLPGWADRLLSTVLPRGVVGASIVGDLGQEYAEFPSGPRRGVWLAWEVTKLVTYYGIRSIGGGGGGVMGGLVSLRFALRRMRRDPAFSGLAVLTIALGVGATVGLFSLVKGVLLDPLPYDEPTELVAVFEAFPGRNVTRNVANPGNVAAWSRAAALEGVGSIVLSTPRILEGAGEASEVMSNLVTPEFLDVLGVQPVLGRSFSSDDATPMGNEAVLTHRGWQELFGGDPAIIGRGLTLNGTATTVVGVLPAVHIPFADGSLVLLGVPLGALGDQTNTGRFLNVVARLAPGVGIERAREELDGVQVGLREDHPDFNAGWTLEIEPLRAVVLGDVQSPLWILLSSVAMLLLVACVNVANLTLARATDRQSEMAVRTSLGASGGMLARQLIVESVVLAGAGGAVGVALAWGATKLLTAPLLEAFAIPRLGEVSLDASVLLFSLAVTALTGLLFGLAPAVSVARRGAGDTLGSEARGPSRRTGRVRSALVVAEVALSVVLLVSAALLVKSLTALTGVETGFEATRVVTGRVNLTGPRYQGTAPDHRFFSALEPGLSSIPGIEAAGGVTFLPLDGLGSATSYYAADRPVPPREEWSVADVRPVVGDYFAAMGIAVLRGRGFADSDTEGSPRVVVVSEALAARAWPGEDPLGKPLAINWSDLEPWTVVGVVEDVVHRAMEDTPREMVYHTYAQAPYFNFMTLVLRTRSSEAAAVAGLKDAVAAIDPAVPVTRVQTLDGIVRRATARPRMTAFLITLFAGAAALLTAVGLYGVVSHSVARRVREIGVRIALGARADDVVRMISWQGFRLILLGLGLGLVGAGVASRFLGSVLFQTSVYDPTAFAGAAALFTAVGMLACVVPTLRAVRIEPSRALRES